MKTRTIILFCAFMLGVAVLCSAADPVVAQPDSMNLTATERTLLQTGITKLEVLLSDPTLGPQRRLGQDGWIQDSFALFAAGSLEERGYSVYLARGGQNVWVLVGLVIEARTVWMPVEPSPSSAGTTQTTLGRIPSVQPSSSSLLLEERYLTFDSVSLLPPNQSPIARFRTSEDELIAGQSVQLIASRSSDPDGAIALYRWCIGETPCFVTKSWSHVVTLDEPGLIEITLIVIDNAGRSASVSSEVRVRRATLRPQPTGGCGCG
jgi:hypothetical protein